jgi:zinc-binding dehydrogenase
MLSECTPLQPGDWVVQNAANSGVGRSLIALAKLRGLKTINLARDDTTFAELTAAGADVVHVDDPDAVGDVRAVIGDARVALAVEAVGGPGVARLLELLSDGGWLVSYSWARDEPMWVDTSTLVGKHLTVRGFFVGDFDYRDKVVPVIREAAPLVADGALVVPVAAVYPPGAHPGRGATSLPWRQDPAESGGAMNARPRLHNLRHGAGKTPVKSAFRRPLASKLWPLTKTGGAGGTRTRDQRIMSLSTVLLTDEF